MRADSLITLPLLRALQSYADQPVGVLIHLSLPDVVRRGEAESHRVRRFDRLMPTETLEKFAHLPSNTVPTTQNQKPTTNSQSEWIKHRGQAVQLWAHSHLTNTAHAVEEELPKISRHRMRSLAG